MKRVHAEPIAELDLIRLDIVGDGHRTSELVTIDEAIAAATALKVAVARLRPKTRKATP